jgi:hypothetical protein
MTFSKNWVRFTSATSALVIAALIGSLLTSKKAEAAIGLLIAATSRDESVQSFGWVFAGVGLLTAVASTQIEVYGCQPAGNYTQWCGDTNQTNGSVLTVGLVMLGTEASPNIAFLPLDEKSASELNVTLPEETAFNGELARVNLISNDFLTRLRDESLEGKNASELKEDSRTLWETQAKPLLNPLTYSALKKVTGAYLKAFDLPAAGN